MWSPPTAGPSSRFREVADYFGSALHQSAAMDVSDGAVWIECWFYLLCGQADKLPDWLSEAERRRMESTNCPIARAAFFERRTLIRSILAGYTDLHPSDVNIETTSGGKPFLPGPNAPYFSISHTGHGFVLVASNRMVGIDMEGRSLLDPDQRLRHLLAVEDRLLLTRLDEASRNRLCMQFWTRWEAMRKASGEHDYNLRLLSAAADRRPLEVAASGKLWRIEDIDLPVPLHASIAFRVGNCPGADPS